MHPSISFLLTSLFIQNYEESEACLTRLLQIDPDNKAGKAELVKLKKAKKEYAARSKEISKNIASKLFSETSNAAKLKGKSKQSLESNVMAASTTTNAATATVAASSTAADIDGISNSGDNNKAATVVREGEGDKETDAAAVEAKEPSNSLPFLFLVSTSVIVLIISLLIAIYISYNA